MSNLGRSSLSRTTSGGHLRRRFVGAAVAGALAISAASITTGATASADENPEAIDDDRATAAPEPSADAVATESVAACLGENVASYDKADFVDKLGLNRRTAERAAQIAPDLRRVEQLLAVPGIGPGTLSRIISSHPDICASPAVIPPDTKDECVDPSQFDLNNLADPNRRAELAAGTVLSPLEVRKMSELGPFASLEIALSVQGLGSGVKRKLTSTTPPMVCVTPPGFETIDGTTYEWITSFENDRVEADGFTLTVAAGTLESPTGSWAYVDRDDIESELAIFEGVNLIPNTPRADVGILDTSWQDGTKTVWVTQPADQALDLLDVPKAFYVYHELANGDLEMFHPGAILQTGDMLTVETTSTSPFWNVGGVLWEGIQFIRGRRVTTPNCPLPSDGAEIAGATVSTSAGSLIKPCTRVERSDGSAGGKLTVAADATVRWSDFNNVDFVAGNGNDPISTLIARNWPFGSGELTSFGSTNELYVPPAAPYWDGLTYVQPAQFGTLRADPEAAATAVGYVGDQLIGLIWEALYSQIQGVFTDLGYPAPPDAESALFLSLVTCAYGLVNAVADFDPAEIGDALYGVFTDCFPNALKTWFVDTVAAGAGSAVTSNNPQLQEAGLAVIAVGLVVDRLDQMLQQYAPKVVKQYAGPKLVQIAADIAISTVDIVRLLAADSLITVFVPAEPPTNLDSGEPIPASCLQSDGSGGWTVRRTCVIPPVPDDPNNDPVDNNQGGVRIMATGLTNGLIPASPDTLGKVLIHKDGSQRGYLNSEGILLTGVDNTEWFCNTVRGVPIAYWVSDSNYDSWVADETDGSNCGSTSSIGNWIGEGFTNWILRNRYTGESYLLQGTTIFPIADGGTFICLAQSYLVRDVNDPTVYSTGGLSLQPFAVGADAFC